MFPLIENATMQINIIYDPSVANAPAGFTTAVMDAVNYLDKLFINPISITINVGYGEVAGFQLASNALGESYYPVGEPETYSAVVSALKAENAPGASTLPSNSPFPANYILYLSPAETKALGLPLSVPDGGVDGYIGFSSAPNTSVMQMAPLRLRTSIILSVSWSTRSPRSWAGSRCSLI